MKDHILFKAHPKSEISKFINVHKSAATDFWKRISTDSWEVLTSLGGGSMSRVALRKKKNMLQ